MRIWALVPVKPLIDSKSRLSETLTAGQRARFTLMTLERTIYALQCSPTIEKVMVVSRDSNVLKLARREGALTFDEHGRHDLNSALNRAAQTAASRGVDGVIVLPSDLPLISIEDVSSFVNGSGAGADNNGHELQQATMTICSDQHGTGTNALMIQPPGGFTFRFGEGSYQQHLAEAEKLGMTIQYRTLPGIAFDIDSQVDWLQLSELDKHLVAAIIGRAELPNPALSDRRAIERKEVLS